MTSAHKTEYSAVGAQAKQLFCAVGVHYSVEISGEFGEIFAHFMKIHLYAVCGLGLLAAAALAQDKKPEAKPGMSEADKVAYAIGMNTGSSVSNNLKSMNASVTPEAIAGFTEALKGTTVAKINYGNGLSAGLGLSNGLKRAEAEVNMDAVIKGFADALNGTPSAVSPDEMRTVLGKFQQELQAKQREKQKIAMEKQAADDKIEAVKNKEDGQKFLDVNATKPGVKKLPSGMQYKVLAEGAGESPKETDRVSVIYRGTFIDGTEFDSTLKNGNKPAVFGVKNVIAGWTEALLMMKPGAKWQLAIPANLAYGDNRRPGNPPIPAGSTLLFDVELVKIEAPPTPPPSAQPLTSDIIKVPSAEGLKRGEQIKTLKPEDIEKEKAKEKGNQ